MNLPTSRPSIFCLRGVLMLMRGVAEWRVIGRLMRQPLMIIVSQVGGLVFGHLLELQQRTNVLTLTKLSQDLLANGYPATEKERHLISRAFMGSRLPSAILQARIDLVDLQLKQVIGSGQFGVVNHGLWHGEVDEPRSPPKLSKASVAAAASTAAPSPASSSSTSLKRTGKHVAIKTAHRNRLTTQFLDTYLRTAELELSLAPHVNILQLLGVAWSIDAARISSVFELCTGGSLGEALGQTSLRWSVEIKVRIASGLANGLAFLHTRKPIVIHRDVKPANILLTSPHELIPKIADFGASRAAPNQRELLTSDCSTPLFSAPEQLSHRQYDESVDVWACGCCLVCLFHDSQSPYVTSDEKKENKSLSPSKQDVLRRVAEGSHRPSLAKGKGPNEVGVLIEASCRYEPSKRLTAVELSDRMEEVVRDPRSKWRVEMAEKAARVAAARAAEQVAGGGGGGEAEGVTRESLQAEVQAAIRSVRKGVSSS